jgi:polyisoprenoid-binding protein YceI
LSTVTDLLNSPETVGTWTLDEDRSSFSFKNKTMWGLSNVTGRFTEFSGDGRVEAGGAVSGLLHVKAATVTTGIKQRDNHLRSADFFDAENHPDITVTVNGVDSAGADGLNVRADLSIRGNTIALPMKVRAEVLDDGAVRLTATTTVEREQLGVSGNMVGMVGKTTTLSADTVFRRAGHLPHNSAV